MIEVKEKLSSLKVAHTMVPNLITVSAHSTMSEAADILCEYGISGAPVVDERSQCVGVISASDFVHSKAEELDANFTYGVSIAHRLSRPAGAVSRDLVRQHMTPVVKTVVEDSPLIEAARTMCREHVHRLIVVDRQGSPVGIVTSLNLVATLIAVAEE